MLEQKFLENGFAYLDVKNDFSEAKIALQGAHIYQYKAVKKDELLWTSKESSFELGTAIRGGIPICWPRFGNEDKALPQHGFSRTAMFELFSSKEINNNTTEIVLRLKDTDESRRIWNHKFILDVVFTLSDSLSIQLKTTNLDEESFMITQALHTYFDISDISNIHIDGLDSKEYLNALDGSTYTQYGSIRFEKEVDSVYQGVDKEIILKDKHRDISIQNTNSNSVVIWNPWIDKCRRMSGMKENAYREFICIESSNAFEDSVVVESNNTFTLSATLSY